MRLERAPSAWLDQQAQALIWTTAITVLEVRVGLLLTPLGARRSRYEEAFAGLLDLFGDRILPFDNPAAEKAAELHARREREGRTAGLIDAQIAGIALARRAAVATRNVRHFEDARIQVLNPWS